MADRTVCPKLLTPLLPTTDRIKFLSRRRHLVAMFQFRLQTDQHQTIYETNMSQRVTNCRLQTLQWLREVTKCTYRYRTDFKISTQYVLVA